MPDNRFVPIVIGGFVILSWIAAAVLYIWLFQFIPGGLIVQLLIGAGTLALVIAMTVIVRARLRELAEENPNDYRNY